MPVDLFGCVGVIAEIDGDLLALSKAKQRSGKLSVVGGDGNDFLGSKFEGPGGDVEGVVGGRLVAVRVRSSRFRPSHEKRIGKQGGAGSCGGGFQERATIEGGHKSPAALLDVLWVLAVAIYRTRIESVRLFCSRRGRWFDFRRCERGRPCGTGAILSRPMLLHYTHALRRGLHSSAASRLVTRSKRRVGLAIEQICDALLRPRIHLLLRVPGHSSFFDLCPGLEEQLDDRDIINL
jgi:hypothetical protein